MNALDALLQRTVGVRPAFMAHCIAGYPTVSDSVKVGRALVAGGADILELQVPFSDPIADGPSIMEASEKAIARGFKVRDTFVVAGELARKTHVPVVLMSYLNPVFRYGIERFVSDAKDSGVSALIIPDAPFDSEEGIQLLEGTRKNGMHLIPVVSPGVRNERLAKLLPAAGGFVYCTSRQGITGANSRFASSLQGYLGNVRSLSNLPLGLGFGLKSRDDFLKASGLADIVIAGSVFVEVIRDSGTDFESALVKAVASLVGG